MERCGTGGPSHPSGLRRGEEWTGAATRRRRGKERQETPRSHDTLPSLARPPLLSTPPRLALYKERFGIRWKSACVIIQR